MATERRREIFVDASYFHWSKASGIGIAFWNEERQRWCCAAMSLGQGHVPNNWHAEKVAIGLGLQYARAHPASAAIKTLVIRSDCLRAMRDVQDVADYERVSSKDIDYLVVDEMYETKLGADKDVEMKLVAAHQAARNFEADGNYFADRMSKWGSGLSEDGWRFGERLVEREFRREDRPANRW